jgi:hypothetical protein
MAKHEWKFTDAHSLIQEALTLDYFKPHPLDGVTPIPAFFEPGRGNLAVIVGENASGKSFMRRIVTQICRETKVECIPISMEGRGGNYGGMRGFIYGDETWESTGVNSAGTVQMGIKTCKDRTTPHVIFWDEPDLGLSENGAAGVGRAIADYMIRQNPMTLAAVVVTHSKPLVREMNRAYADLDPHYLHLGCDSLEDTPKTLYEWLNSGEAVCRSPEDIEEAGARRFKLIQRILKSVP